MRDFAFFPRNNRDFSWKQRGKQERDTGCQFLRDSNWPAQKPQAGRKEPFVRIAVSGFKLWIATALCTLSGSVKRIHYRLTTLVSWDCMTVWGLWVICVDLWHLSISDIFDACVSNLGPPILYILSSLSTFSRTLGFFWPGRPHRMAMIVVYRVKYATLWFASKDVQAVTQKEKFWGQISRKVKAFKALKETVKCVNRPSFKYGNEQSFSFNNTWTKENKTVNC